MGQQLGISVLSCVGGTAVGNNIKKLKQSGAQIIVGTMGRIGDLVNKSIISIETCVTLPKS